MIVLSLILALTTLCCPPDTTTSTQYNSSPSISRLGLIAGSTVISATALYIYQRNAWWKDQRGPFHIQNDWEYALWADKLGHLLGGIFISKLYHHLFLWAGLSDHTSQWIGAGVGSLYLLYIEVQDGFARDWGFSPGDAAFDLIGAFYPLLQRRFPLLQPISIKMSYWPSGRPNKAVFDDYEGQTYWLTANLRALGIRQSPSWLNLAIGYAARKPGRWGFLTEPRFFVGIDFELSDLLTPRVTQLPFAKPLLESFHAPAPALQVYPRLKPWLLGY